MKQVTDQDPYIEYKERHKEVRFRHWNYYERLALIDGGIIALAVTTVLGNLHSQLKHKYTLAVGLGMLLIAMCCLLIRNLIESRREMLMTDQEYYRAMRSQKGADHYQAMIDKLGKRTKPLEFFGVWLTMLGIVLLGLVLILSII
jgi:hypothetical protein